jgi:drug/metabolite transporter (DMT)-like permease
MMCIWRPDQKRLRAWQKAEDAAIQKYLTDLGLLGVVMVWGFSPTLFQIALAQFQPLTFVLLRFVLLSLVALAVLWVRGRRGVKSRRIGRRDILWLVASGLCGYGVYQLLYIQGLAHTTVFASSLLAATVPLFSVIFLALLRVERVHPAQWGGVLASFGGVALFMLASGGQGAIHVPGHMLTAGEVLVGDTLSLLAPLLFALYGIFNKRLVQTYSPPELMAYTLVIATVFLLPFCLPSLTTQQWSHIAVATWLIIPYSVLFPIYLTYLVWNWAIGRKGVGYVTVYFYLVPILSGAFSFALLGQRPGSLEVAGAAIVLGGMGLARWGVRLAAGSGKARP